MSCYPSDLYFSYHFHKYVIYLSYMYRMYCLLLIHVNTVGHGYLQLLITRGCSLITSDEFEPSAAAWFLAFMVAASGADF